MDIITNQEINASASAVWNVLGEQFADISDWAKVIQSSKLDGPLGVGGVRTCVLESGALTEELIEFDREARTLTYKLTSGTPPMLKTIRNHWTVESNGQAGARVTSHVTLQLRWWAFWMAPMVRKMLGRDIGGILRQLAVRAESGGES